MSTLSTNGKSDLEAFLKLRHKRLCMKSDTIDGHMDVEETGEDNFMITDQRFIWRRYEHII